MSRILIIEDDVDFSASLKELLSFDDTVIDIAYDIQVAIRFYIKRYEYDLLISDIKVGNEIATNYLEKFQEDQPHVPIIIISAYPSMETAIEGLRNGVADYFTKPINPSILLSAVKKTIERYQKDRKRVNNAATAAAKLEEFKTQISQ